MRIALVLSPPQFVFTGTSGAVPSRMEAPLRSPVVDAMRDHLARSGFRVTEITTSADLASELDRVTTSLAADDHVLLYLAGATDLHDDGSLTLRLDWEGEQSLDLRALGDSCARAKTLYVLDTVHDGFANDTMRAAEHVEAAMRAMKAGQGGSSLLIGVSPEPTEEGAQAWPLSRHLLRALDDPSLAERGEVSVARAFDRLRDMPEVRREIPGLAYVSAESPFLLGVSSPPPKASRRPVRATDAPRSMLPRALPLLEPILTAATQAREKGAWEDALDAYKKALMVVLADSASKASIYASIAEVKLAQGKTREAEMNFEKALGVLPGHPRSLDALVVLATEALDWKRVVEYRRLIVKTREDPRRKAEELCTIATLLETEIKDGKGAAVALEQARAVAPDDVNVLRRLRAIYETTQSWTKLVDLLGALSLEEPAAAARAELRFVQADVSLARLRDEPRGLELLEMALEDDPAHERALGALVAVRTRREEWRELGRLYARLAEQCATKGLTDRAYDICKRLALVRRDRLRDGGGAIEAYRGALHCRPRDADARAMIAELLVAKGEPEAALRELETASAHAPLRVATYRRMFEIHARGGRTDSAWLAATALDELGAAEVDHDLLIDQWKPQGAIRASTALDDAGWSCLRARGVDGAVSAVLRAVAPAAISLRVEELRARKQLVTLDPQRRQDPTGTVSIVRTFAWASQVLGIKIPELYVLDDVPGGLAAVPLATPTTAIGPSVLRGMSVPRLAFLVARHLTYYRPEYYALVFFPSVSELSTLVLSAIKIALPRVATSKPVEVAAKRLERVLERQGKAAREQLTSAVRSIDERSGRMDLGAWVRGVELTAHRAGLLLAGDLSSVIPHMTQETRSISDLSFEDKRGDLLAFSVSRDMALLRAELGIAIKS